MTRTAAVGVELIALFYQQTRGTIKTEQHRARHVFETGPGRRTAMNNPHSTFSIGGHPVHVMIVPFVIAFYTGAFAGDLAYAGTSDAFWARGAIWLLAAGVVMSVLAALAGITDFLSDARIRALSASWWHFGGNALVAVISIVDVYLRYVQGYEIGSSQYVWMTGLVFLILLFTGWKGWEMVYQDHVGVSDETGHMHPAE